MLNVIIKNGYIVDGSGQKGYTADIGVIDDRIIISPKLNLNSNRIINAEGFVVSPGFIDIHSHTDHLVYANQTCESKVTQGVTLEVSGNCGESAAPRGGYHCDEAMCDWGPDHGVIPDWQSMGEFLDKLELLPKTINFATYTGHGTLRGVVIGYDDRSPSTAELASMCTLLEESLQAGSFGLSTGLIYPPGCYANTVEIIALCKICKKYNGIYASHLRNEAFDLLNSVDEAISIGKSSGVSVQLSHHKACGNRARGLVNQSLIMIDKARHDGVDVWADQYPYNATCTSLSSLLPSWIHDGGVESMLSRLKDDYTRRQLKEYLKKESEPDGRIGDTGGWESILINHIFTPELSKYEGMNITEISKMYNKEPEDVMIDLLIKDNANTGIIHFTIDDNDIKTVMKHDSVLIGSDATARTKSGVLSSGKPHPRAFGTFPRILGKYVREEHLLSLEAAIAKMTGKTASRLKIVDRGFIRDGYFADLVIFDPDKINDKAGYLHPHQYSEGVEYVFVNGEIVYNNSQIANIAKTHPGRVIRRIN